MFYNPSLQSSIPVHRFLLMGIFLKMMSVPAFETQRKIKEIIIKGVLGNEIKTEKFADKINIDVIVEGVKDVIIQNDEGTLDPSKPFTPFGTQPKVGSSFIVGSKEIFQKKLTQLSLVVDWDDVPDSLADQLDEALHEYERTLSYLDVKRKFHTVKTFVLSKGKWTLLDLQKGIFIEDNLYNVIFDWTRPQSKYANKISQVDIEHAVINITPGGIYPTEKNYDKCKEKRYTK